MDYQKEVDTHSSTKGWDRMLSRVAMEFQQVKDSGYVREIKKLSATTSLHSHVWPLQVDTGDRGPSKSQSGRCCLEGF